MVCLRLDELRHRLIPLYTYDPAEEQAWGNEEDGNEEEELTVSKRNNPFTLSKAYHLNVNGLIYEIKRFLSVFVPGTFIQGREAVALRCLWNLSTSDAEVFFRASLSSHEAELTADGTVILFICSIEE